MKQTTKDLIICVPAALIVVLLIILAFQSLMVTPEQIRPAAEVMLKNMGEL